jgi:single-strand DNA-binding protein
MKGINKASFVGAVATQPELRYTAGGMGILELTLAGRSPVETEGGDYKDLSFYQRVKAFGKFAEALAESIHAGDVVAVEGRLDYRSWEGHNQVRKSSVEVVIESIHTLNPEHFTLETDKKDQSILLEGVNEVTLGGNLTGDAELKYLATGTAVTRLNIAVNESVGKDERVGFHRIEAWRGIAEVIAEAAKGEGVIVKGRLVNESWEDKDGNRQYGTKVEAKRVYRVASRGEARQAPPAKTQEEAESADLPF